ncbi:carboxypeptidase regulatory-like domain-containing protein, partial [candidate division WOR-3 bacterium]|nr:carboxypeptidase regulatory-like domain-containing protein [candidate division WOR-3 bacterium]
MNRTLLAMIAVAALVATSIAYPGIGGGRGLFRVQNALVQDDAGLTISFDVIGRNPTFPETAGEKGWVADLIAPELNYAPLATKWVGAELFASWGGIFQYPQSVAEKGFLWGLHDLKAGAKLSIPIIPVLKLGGMVDYTFIKREQKGWLDPSAVPMAEGLGWKALATLQLQDLASSLPNVFVNYSQADETATYGAGVELAAEAFALFAEAQSIQPAETSTGIFDTENGVFRLTPGVAFGTGTSGTTLKAGYTFAWGAGAANEVLLGVVIATPFGRRAPPEFGVIAGRVVDERNGEPIAGVVSLPETPGIRPEQVGAQTGIFRFERVPAGLVVVEARAEGYASSAVPVEVMDDAVAQQEFRLRPLVTYGTLAGKVVDDNTGNPVPATIMLAETELPGDTVNVATGAWRIDNVPVGIYQVRASSPGYFQAVQTVQVEADKVTTADFRLKPLTETSTITGRVFDRKTDEPLTAVVSFVNSFVPPETTDRSTGVYSVEVPVGAYTVRVESEDYIEQTAAVVVQKDQPLVRDFGLVKEGMT